MNNRIPSQTHIASVKLNVSDLERTLEFYRERLGFRLTRNSSTSGSIRAGDTEIARFEGVPNATHQPRTNRLYHFAVRVPSRRALAQVLKHLLGSETPIQGYADHLGSEAVYLADPEGNGIEIYRDRPRDQWPRTASGELKMATDPLDLQGVLAELGGPPIQPFQLDPATRMGHIHLHVQDLESAVGFYRDVLGFDLVMRYGPSAAFLSAGGYHHHLGLNTWAAVGSAPPPESALGMQYFVIKLPDRTALDGVIDRLQRVQVQFAKQDHGVFVRDPSGNGILLSIG